MRRLIRVRGVVQGVGFRPFVHRLAEEFEVSGSVRNDAAGVVIDAEGDPEALVAFVGAVRSRAPRLSRIDSIDVEELPATGAAGFVIEQSRDASGTTSIPADSAVCPACLTELRDPANRRHGYALIACTDCGPRYTIVKGLPVDRPATTMSEFPLCQNCQDEYDDPRSRRFHAQPTACPECGPRLRLDDVPPGQEVAAAAAALAGGRVVALKGVGGYHLACDARNVRAVAALRQRKGRGSKPFALMAADLATAGQLVELDPDESAALASPAAPIVLAASRDDALRDSVAPGQACLGVMLPYAPLHHLLFDAGAPELLVMTSGNLAEEPICIDPDEAEVRLAELADAFLHHDRPIHVPCDDSVVQLVGDGIQPVRRSRGYVPLPVRLPFGVPPVLAVGGELKTTIAVAEGDLAWLSQHIGDTANLETLEVLSRTAVTLAQLQRVRPSAVVSDLHPGYLSRRWAIEEAARLGVEHVGVQHHHAHLASLLADNGCHPEEGVLGIVFDGTGYGTDATIWGGELLLGGYEAVERVGRLRPVPLPGGDAAIRRPLRSSLAHLWAAGLPWDEDLAPLAAAEPGEAGIVRGMLETGTGCTPTSSVGRLFDAFASLLGVCHEADYEAQAAMELEAIAGRVSRADGSPLPIAIEEEPSGQVELDPAPALATAIAALRSGATAADLARAFHAGLAHAVVRAAVLLSDTHGPFRVGLTGGVFVNRLLAAECVSGLEAAGFAVLTHHQVPPNDGGLALGQVAVAGRRAAVG